MSQQAPRGIRIHIGIFGRRNVGKSSILNALTRQSVSIVSDEPGTTTDPVEKPMELLPLGPVVFIDTAGVDDAGDLGALRVERTRKVLERTDVAILVASAGAWGAWEEELLSRLRDGPRPVPVVVALNQSDLAVPPSSVTARLEAASVPWVATVATRDEGVAALRDALVAAVPEALIEPPPLLGDLVPPGEPVVLVVPIDKEAPKGRIILPQVQAIRDALDHGAWCVVCRDEELPGALARLARPPALVVTDSQAFGRVASATPAGTPMTSFSILMARFKGDLAELVEGARAIERLGPGDRVLVAEACTHHPIGEDIGRVKIPRWLNEHCGGELRFTTVQGRDFPEDLSPYRLVIHCGACMWNRASMLSRIHRCREAGVPITNYGLAIAYSLGVFERAIAPFAVGSRPWR